MITEWPQTETWWVCASFHSITHCIHITQDFDQKNRITRNNRKYGSILEFNPRNCGGYLNGLCMAVPSTSGVESGSGRAERNPVGTGGAQQLLKPVRWASESVMVYLSCSCATGAPADISSMKPVLLLLHLCLPNFRQNVPPHSC